MAQLHEVMALCDELEADGTSPPIDVVPGSALHALAEAETPGDVHQAWNRVNANWLTLA